GEYQPERRNTHRTKGDKRKRVPDGDPIPNYFPAAFTESEWFAAREGTAQRTQKRGRTAEHVNLFAGLVKEARLGDSYHCVLQSGWNGKGEKCRILLNNACREGRGEGYTLRYDVFERAILSRLKEIKPHDILNGETGPDETIVLAGELAKVSAEKAE